VVVAGNAVVGHEQTSFKLQTTATTRQWLCLNLI
jgi:hypothetical protein